MNKRLGALSLAKRAGALAVGFDAAMQRIHKGDAALLLLAQDISPKTQKRVLAACDGKCEAKQMRLTQQDIATITRKPAGVLAITNKDMAALYTKAALEEEAD